MREMRFGEDGSFSWESMTERHNADLANGLGNLVSRVLAMLASSFDGEVPEPGTTGAEGDLPQVVDDAVRRYDEHLQAVRLQPGLVAVWDVVDRANGYLVEKAPWKLAKDEGARDELAGVLYASTEVLRILAIFDPTRDARGRRAPLGAAGIAEPLGHQRVPDAVAWGGLAPGTKTTKGAGLFPRLDVGA